MKKTREFECYLCKQTHTTDREPCFHYDTNEQLDNDEVISLCDNCAEIAIQKLIDVGVKDSIILKCGNNEQD